MSLETTFRELMIHHLFDYDSGTLKSPTGHFAYFRFSSPSDVRRTLRAAFDSSSATNSEYSVFEPGFYLAVMDDSGSVTVSHGSKESIVGMFNDLQSKYVAWQGAA